MIPFKKLLAFEPPVPSRFPIVRNEAICAAAVRDVGSKVFAEFAYWYDSGKKPYPALRVFTDGDSVKIWNSKTGKEATGMLGQVYFVGEIYYSGGVSLWWSNLTVRDDDSVADVLSMFFGRYNGTAQAALEGIQKKRRAAANSARISKEREYREDVFGLIPDRDVNEFRQFIKDVVMPEHYIFQQPGKCRERRGYCTYCEQWIPLWWSYRHNDAARCPRCNKWVTVKDVRRGHNKVYHVGLFAVVDRLGDESVVLRTYETRVDYGSVSEDMTHPPLIRLCEGTRHVINYKGRSVRYEYLQEYNYANGRTSFYWTRRQDFDNNGTVYSRYQNVYNAYIGRKIEPNGFWLYRTETADAFKNTKLKYVDFLGEWGDRVSDLGALKLPHFFHFALREFFENPVVEYLYKYGAHQLLKEPNPARYGLKLGAKSVPEVFGGLTVSAVTDIIKHDPKPIQLYTAMQINARGITPSFENVETFVRLAGGIVGSAIYHIKHLAALPEAARKYKYQMAIYRDYIDMCKQLNYDLTDKYVEFPKDLHHAHNAVCAVIEIKKNPKLNTKIIKLEKKTNAVYAYENDVYLIRAPHDVPDFVVEAKQQNNCVARVYMEKYARGDCVILFVRKKTDAEDSYITVEIRKNKINQYYAKGNKAPDVSGMNFKEEYDAAVLAPLRKKERVKA